MGPAASRLLDTAMHRPARVQRLPEHLDRRPPASPEPLPDELPLVEYWYTLERHNVIYRNALISATCSSGYWLTRSFSSS